MANDAIRVVGLNDLLRAFAAADKHLRSDLTDALQEAGQPVRTTAETLAGSQIRNLGAGRPWTRMRVAARGSTVIVAPVERGTRQQRYRRGWNTGPPSFPSLLLSRALEPALTVNRERVRQRLDRMLGEVKAVWERYG